MGTQARSAALARLNKRAARLGYLSRRAGRQMTDAQFDVFARYVEYCVKRDAVDHDVLKRIAPQVFPTRQRGLAKQLAHTLIQLVRVEEDGGPAVYR